MPKNFYLFTKPIFDRFFAFCGLAIALLPMILIAGLLLFYFKGKVLFKQVRIGRNEKPFTIFKFRTMCESRNIAGDLLPDNERLTRLGRFLRKTSLDELPQLWNVLIGDMSLVGPRPLLPEYVPLYNAEQHTRHQVKPGITGWAQVKGGNRLAWSERLDLDVWYVKNRSFALDLKILGLTLLSAFRRKENEIVSEKFRGNFP
jgi:undecaprenyl phosphate N,N'-diacetylbacillosamine 1-phosphate transferase